MVNEKALTGGLVGTGISAGGILLSTSELSMWVSIICAVSGLIVSIIATIIIPLAQGKKVTQQDLNNLTDRLDETAKKMDEISHKEDK